MLSQTLGLGARATCLAPWQGWDVAISCDHLLCPSFCRVRAVLGRDPGNPGPQPMPGPTLPISDGVIRICQFYPPLQWHWVLVLLQGREAGGWKAHPTLSLMVV